MNAMTLNHPSRKPRRPKPRHYSLGKRLFDLCGAAAGLIATAPIVLLCMAWIKLVDGGPVFYEQWRVGRDGWLFRIYKLRTMRQNAEAGEARFASDGDPRVLTGCRWMRTSHVDELPQLLNILWGDMSLVGPRPERPEIIERLKTDLPGIERRLAATPGLTGLAQVRNGYTNDLAGMRRKLAYDLAYLRRPSLLADLRLVVATLPLFWDHAAC